MNKVKELRKQKKKLDKEAREKALFRYNQKCAVPSCLETKRLNAHHIIPREIIELRWDEDNLIVLCPRHHKFSRQLSAHKNSFAFCLFLQQVYPVQYYNLISKLRKNDCKKTKI